MDFLVFFVGLSLDKVLVPPHIRLTRYVNENIEQKTIKKEIQ
jgi:hypothetical protein